LFKLKEKEGIHQFRSIATEVAVLVKKYRSLLLSGEHGDGIVRGSFTFMIGDKNYELLKRIKLAFDLIQ
jgi:FAD/FMN-containing dehydrogenase